MSQFKTIANKIRKKNFFKWKSLKKTKIYTVA